jgi:pimeloyl-ACP methyl ester carboxylesterase
VVAPTLTGLSDRAHLLSPLVGLSTHVEDVVRVIDVIEGDVVLVGHSYAGMVITAAADRRPERVVHRVHLDAFVPFDGEAAIGLLPEQIQHHYVESVEERGWGWMIPPRSLQVLGVTDQVDLDWLTPRLTPHPWLTYTEPVRLTGASDSVTATFIECVDWMRVFEPYAERARGLGWRTEEIATGHEAMVTAPQALSDLLLDVARTS